MQTLTKEIVFENAMSAIECVKWYWPNLSNSQADWIIWEMTAFPFSKGDMFMQELRSLYEKYPDINNEIPSL